MIEPIKLLIANVFLVRGEKNIVIDTGKPGDEDAILRALAKKGIQPGDVDLILLTHGHGDHAGSAKELRDKTGAAIAVHTGDAAMVRTGDVGDFVSINMEGAMVKRFVQFRFTPFEPDIVLQSDSDLRQLGLDADLLHTPGHSDGSISMLFSNGEAIIGDVLRGGMMGGNLFSGMPQYPYFLPSHEHKAQLNESIRLLLDSGAHTFYVGHGGKLSAQDVRRWFGGKG